jgi:hypothetical protein
MDTVFNAAFFIGGIFFAAAFPQPSTFIREQVGSRLKAAWAKVTGKPAQ